MFERMSPMGLLNMLSELIVPYEVQSRFILWSYCGKNASRFEYARGANTEKTSRKDVHFMNSTRRRERRTQYEKNDHKHCGEEDRPYVDLVPHSFEGGQRRLAAIQHDAETAKHHAER